MYIVPKYQTKSRRLPPRKKPKQYGNILEAHYEMLFFLRIFALYAFDLPRKITAKEVIVTKLGMGAGFSSYVAFISLELYFIFYKPDVLLKSTSMLVNYGTIVVVFCGLVVQALNSPFRTFYERNKIWRVITNLNEVDRVFINQGFHIDFDQQRQTIILMSSSVTIFYLAVFLFDELPKTPLETINIYSGVAKWLGMGVCQVVLGSYCFGLLGILSRIGYLNQCLRLVMFLDSS